MKSNWKAFCADCVASIPVVDRHGCWKSAEREWMCPCPRDHRCKAYAPGADDAHNDPRTGQAANINRRNAR